MFAPPNTIILDYVEKINTFLTNLMIFLYKTFYQQIVHTYFVIKRKNLAI